MKLEFKDVINKEQNKSAVVIGLGPSLGKHQETIKQLPKDNFIIIGCNDIDRLTTIDPDYWVLANSIDTISTMHTRLNSKKNCITVYADSVDLTPRDGVDGLLLGDYLPYDERHMGGNGCGSGRCCKFIIPGRLTIHEELQKYTGYNKCYGFSGTVAVHMLSLAILLGCKNIYVTGVDLDYSKGYVGGQNAAQAKAFHDYADSFTKNLPAILETITIINNSAKNIGVNIYCLDPGLPISSALELSELAK